MSHSRSRHERRKQKTHKHCSLIADDGIVGVAETVLTSVIKTIRMHCLVIVKKAPFCTCKHAKINIHSAVF